MPLWMAKVVLALFGLAVQGGVLCEHSSAVIVQLRRLFVVLICLCRLSAGSLAVSQPCLTNTHRSAMNRIATFFFTYARWVRLALVLSGILVGVLTWLADTQQRTQQRLSLLETESMRSAVEIMSTTLNGNLMGSITMLGIMDSDIKQDVTNGLLSVDAAIDSKLGMVGGAFGTRGVFVVSGDGVVKTSWSSVGKPNTGLDVRFRPYYQMALQGKSSVYAAVGTSSGERTLYFAAPVFNESARSSVGVGAVVAQGKVDRLDELLRQKAGVALLLSPQGVVFASSKEDWLGFLDGQAGSQRVRVIRDLKQFGNWFDKLAPKQLPFDAKTGIQTLDGVRHAVATANVDWNDPSGPWRLVLLEDLTHSVPPGVTAMRAVVVTMLFGLLAWMVLHLLNGRHQQVVAGAQLQLLAADQNRQLALRTQLAAAMLRLQQCNDLKTLASTFLSDAHAMFGVLQGVVYARGQAGTSSFALLAGFAIADEPAATLNAGEGLLGQCAVERQPRVLAAGKEGQSTIQSGLGSAEPQCTVMLPLIRGEDVLGLVEVAALTPSTEFLLGAFSEFAHALALNLEILQRAEQTGQLLAQTEAVRQAGVAQLKWQQKLIDALPYPVFIKDANACFIGFNKSYEETFAVSRADLIGKSVMDLEYLPIDDRRAYDTEDRHVIQSGGQVRKVIDIPFADGKVHRTLYFVVGFPAPDGSPGGLVGTFSDLDAVESLAGTGTQAVPKGGAA